MSVDSNEELLARVYPNFETNYNNSEYLSKQAIMSTSNKIVQQCNFEMVEKILGDIMISLSKDSCIEPDDVARVDSDFSITLRLLACPLIGLP